MENIKQKATTIVRDAMVNNGLLVESDVDNAYIIHNSIYPIKEYNKICSKCRKRVYDNLKLYIATY